MSGEPGGIPAGAGTAEGGDRASRAEVQGADKRRGSHVRLSVSGGVEEERIDLELVATGDGALLCELDNKMVERRLKRAEARIGTDRFDEMLRLLEPVTRQTEALRQGGFPPCSLIGSLDVSIAGRETTIYFMADPEQAKTAGYEAPAEVLRAVDILYDEAERSFGIGRLRP